MQNGFGAKSLYIKYILNSLRHLVKCLFSQWALYRRRKYSSSSSSFLMEHGASTSACHLTLFCAEFFAPRKPFLLQLLTFLCLGSLALLIHCPYVQLPDLHTRFWWQQCYRRFKRHSLPRTLIQPGVCISTSATWVTGPPPNPQAGGPGVHSLSGLYPSTCFAWVALPGV